jgi:hypothetical protein
MTLRASLPARGFTITADGDNLRVQPASRLTPELRAQLRAAKPQILAHVRVEAVAQQPQAPPTTSAPPPEPQVKATHEGPPAAAGLPLPRPFCPPSWSNVADVPTDADTCSCCRLSSWWTEATPRGWRCKTCHPPLHLPADAIRRAP